MAVNFSQIRSCPKKVTKMLKLGTLRGTINGWDIKSKELLSWKRELAVSPDI